MLKKLTCRFIIKRIHQYIYTSDQSLSNSFVNTLIRTLQQRHNCVIQVIVNINWKLRNSSYLCEFHPSSRTGKQHSLVAEFSWLTTVTGDLPAASLAREHALYVLRGTSVIVSDTLVVTHESAHQRVVRKSIW